MLTPFYAALFALVLVVLSVRTLTLRRELKVAIGHGDQPRLERAMRVHANFCEYVPLALLMIFFVETRIGGGWWIHALGVVLLVGRCVHAYGVSQVKETFAFRVSGMAMTFTVLITAALVVLTSYFVYPAGPATVQA